MTETRCFHCHEAVDEQTRIDTTLNNEPVVYCCRGCKAVAEIIHTDGLQDFYKFRSANLSKPEPVGEKDLALYEVYNREDVLDRISRLNSDGRHRNVQLGIEGITCAACVWLIENEVRRLTGVTEFWLSLAKHQAELVWDPQQLSLSEIFLTIQKLGFKAFPFTEGEAEKRLAQEQKTTLLRIGVAGIGMMQSMMLAIPVYFGLTETSDPYFQRLFWYVSLLFAVPVVFFSARPFFRAARRDLQSRHFTMDTPVSLAIGGAFIASTYITLFGGEEVYFDSISMFTFFLLIGRYLETQTRLTASRSQQKLQDSTPTLVERCVGNDETEKVLLEDLREGDQVRLGAGDQVPFDGIVLEGRASVNEAALTGEFAPVSKQTGDTLLSGSYITDNALTLKVTRLGKDSHLSFLNTLVERALAEKPETVILADHVASRFVLAVLGVSLLVALSWAIIDPARAFPITLAVLVATCPCALSLATPVALTAATQALRDRGFVITRPYVLQTLAQAEHLVFDKTGTLTEGRYTLTDLHNYSDLSQADLLSLAGALESDSPHPIARFFAPFAEQSASQIKNHAGEGVAGQIGGKAYQLGSAAFCNTPEEQSVNDPGAKPVYLCCEETLIAVLFLNDSWRAGYRPMLEQLQSQPLNLQLSVFTGDPNADSDALRKQLGVTDVRTGIKPDEKMSGIRALAEKQTVVMLGDGLNDVPAMASAPLSIAVGEASDLTRMKADAMLVNPDIRILPDIIVHSRRCQSIVRQNIAWAIGYNLSILPLAALGWVPPWVAAIGMSSSSLIVVFNALRLKGVKTLG